MASPAILKRVRKLLALATSPNTNEAESAREEAERLMRKHGLSASDVAAPTTMIVEEHLDDFTKDLARVVGKAAGLTVVWNNRGEIAFAGLPHVVSAAAEVYSELKARANAGSTMPSFALPLPPEATLAWRAFYVTGFTAAVERGITAAQKVTAKAPPPPPPQDSDLPIDWSGDGGGGADKEPEKPRPQAERSPAKEMLGLYNAYTDQGTVKWLCDFAYASGEAAGLSAARGISFDGRKRPEDNAKPESGGFNKPALRRLFLR